MAGGARRGGFFSIVGMERSRDLGHVPAIDTLRGLSVVLMLHMHCALAWHGNDWSALSRLMFYSTDFVAPVLYTSMSLLGNMIGHEARRQRGEGNRLTRGTLLRASFLFMYAESLNILTIDRLGWLSFTTWNVILAIAVFTVLLPHVLKMNHVVRLSIVAGIAILYFPLVDLAMIPVAGNPVDIDIVTATSLSNPAALPYWFFFYHDMMTPIFSWFIVLLLIPTIFKRFVTSLHDAQPARLAREIKRVAAIGLALVVLGIATGSWIMPDYVVSNHLQLTTPDAYLAWPLPGEPVFMIRHTPQYMFYNIGVICLLFAAVAWFQFPKVKGSHKNGLVQNLGKMSLTGFNLSLFAFLVPLTLPLPLFYLIVLPGIAIITAIFHVWYTKGHGIASLEWLMRLHVNTISYFLDTRKEKASPAGQQ